MLEERQEKTGINDFIQLEKYMRFRREDLRYHLMLCEEFSGNTSVSTIYQIVRQSYNKLIVEEAQKIVDTYNPDGTPKERNDSDDN